MLRRSEQGVAYCVRLPWISGGTGIEKVVDRGGNRTRTYWVQTSRAPVDTTRPIEAVPVSRLRYLRSMTGEAAKPPVVGARPQIRTALRRFAGVCLALAGSARESGAATGN